MIFLPCVLLPRNLYKLCKATFHSVDSMKNRLRNTFSSLSLAQYLPKLRFLYFLSVLRVQLFPHRIGWYNHPQKIRWVLASVMMNWHGYLDIIYAVGITSISITSNQGIFDAKNLNRWREYAVVLSKIACICNYFSQ